MCGSRPTLQYKHNDMDIAMPMEEIGRWSRREAGLLSSQKQEIQVCERTRPNKNTPCLRANDTLTPWRRRRRFFAGAAWSLGVAAKPSAPPPGRGRERNRRGDRGMESSAWAPCLRAVGADFFQGMSRGERRSPPENFHMLRIPPLKVWKSVRREGILSDIPG